MGEPCKSRNKGQCQSIYWTLIELLEKRPNRGVSPYYLRELYQTERCDTICQDFSQLRRDLETHVKVELKGKDTIDKVRSFTATDQDNEKATQAIIHYWYWHRRQLISTLNLPLWIYYWTWFKVKRMFVSS